MTDENNKATDTSQEEQPKEIDWGAISDDEIAGMSAPPSAEPPADEQNTDPVGSDPAAGDEPTEELDESGNDPEGTDGADSGDQPGSEDGDSEGEPGEVGEEPAPTTSTDNSDPETPSGDQPGESGEGEESDKKSKTEEIDYKARYEEVMAPFKAAGRQITLNNPEEVRRLLQMGVDYNQKMQHLKPHLRIIRSLDKAGLLDQDRINFLIDLNANKPEAIKKLLKDGSIDPMDLHSDEDDASTYSPTDHSVSDTEMGVRDAFEAIESSEHFDRTVTVLTKEWDGKSREALAGNPNLIGLMHAHIADGTFDQVWGEVVKQRMLGNLVGLSDLAAYDQTGEAMVKAGTLADPQPSKSTSSAPATTQAPAQGSGSPDGDGNKAKKRAASPTKGGASGGGKPKIPNFANMSDKEIEEFDHRQLSKL